MNKISEQELKKLFSQNSHPVNDKSIKVVKSTRPFDHIKSVRRKIKNIKEKKKGGNKFDIISFLLKTLLIWGVIGFLLLSFVNFPALFNRLKWSYYIDYLNQKLPANIPELSEENSDIAEIPSELPELKNVENNMINISKISVKAPIVWDVREDNILEELKNGVVHYYGTSHPGEGSNIFISGHSSNYFWISNEYDNIFSLLDKLENGDRIEISYKNKQFFYDVTDKKIVGAKDVGVLYNTPEETLTLMTCWPVGTSLNRLIIQAKLIYTSF